MSGAIRWVPLESNPEIYSSWASSMGLNTDKYAFVDIYGLDDDLLSMVPQPVEAVLLLFPVTKEYEEKRKQEDSDKESFSGPEKEGEMMWFKQTIGNACGTIGLLHSIANSSARNTLAESSPLSTLIKEALPLNATDRASYLQTSKSLAKAHTSAASTGQSAAPSAEDKCDLHFVSFVRDPTSKHLFELDGRRKGPVDRDIEVSKQEDLLKVATQWIAQNYVSDQPKGTYRTQPDRILCLTDELEPFRSQLQSHRTRRYELRETFMMYE
jgi:ubiquitin carboxyl-terminal hydrolase L3